jgi:3-(methylthio)propanoyl-CoA dehydrogenase
MYRAPLKDLHYALETVIGSDALAGCPAFADVTPELARSVLEEAGRFAEGVLDPLYTSADREGARWTDGGVTTPSGFKAAYEAFVAGGWPQLRASPDFGGQGLPVMLVIAVEELFASANLSFRLCPMLTQGATEAISHAGSAPIKERFLPKLVSGEWTGTMNLTEPQAGSDLAQVRTRAVPEGDHYRIFGQKIFITYGEHDLAPNIVHLVLGRIEGAPAGVKGISLFVVPKFLVNDDGSLGERNDVNCASIERKLGIHGSPTCVMMYGQKQGAVGYLVGEANRGLEYMFIMMNAARLSVGLEGYANAERAYQRARNWARERIQGRAPGPAERQPLPIAYHPDVRRMLLMMKSQIEAMRFLALYAATQLDIGSGHADPAVRAAARARGDLLIPIVKGFCTETGLEICSLAVQVHGGMGFIEDTGAAQSLRDARIGTIYEGTTGIQALDLIGRKLQKDGGTALSSLLADIRAELASTPAGTDDIGAAVLAAIDRLELAARHILERSGVDAQEAPAVAVAFLHLAGVTLGGWLMARSARRVTTSGDADPAFARLKRQTAAFYATHVLPRSLTLLAEVQGGAAAVLAVDPDEL